MYDPLNKSSLLHARKRSPPFLSTCCRGSDKLRRCCRRQTCDRWHLIAQGIRLLRGSGLSRQPGAQGPPPEGGSPSQRQRLQTHSPSIAHAYAHKSAAHADEFTQSISSGTSASTRYLSFRVISTFTSGWRLPILTQATCSASGQSSFPRLFSTSPIDSFSFFRLVRFSDLHVLKWTEAQTLLQPSLWLNSRRKRQFICGGFLTPRCFCGRLSNLCL